MSLCFFFLKSVLWFVLESVLVVGATFVWEVFSVSGNWEGVLKILPNQPLNVHTVAFSQTFVIHVTCRQTLFPQISLIHAHTYLHAYMRCICVWMYLSTCSYTYMHPKDKWDSQTYVSTYIADVYWLLMVFSVLHRAIICFLQFQNYYYLFLLKLMVFLGGINSLLYCSLIFSRWSGEIHWGFCMYWSR